MNRLSSKILQKESEGYTLDPKAAIEYIVQWKEPMGAHRYDQILCNICMTK